jgi:hypothetical protein
MQRVALPGRVAWMEKTLNGNEILLGKLVRNIAFTIMQVDSIAHPERDGT